MLDCCIIAIILKQFPLCDSKGMQGACTFKINCNHCAGIIKKCITITENYQWKQWVYQIKGSPPKNTKYNNYYLHIFKSVMETEKLFSDHSCKTDF